MNIGRGGDGAHGGQLAASQITENSTGSWHLLSSQENLIASQLKIGKDGVREEMFALCSFTVSHNVIRSSDSPSVQ